MPERQFDVLAAQHQLPADHGGQHAQEAHRGADGGEGPEDGGVDHLELIGDHVPGGDAGSVGGADRPQQQQPDHANRQHQFQDVEDTAAPGFADEARRQDRSDGDGEQLEEDRHQGGDSLRFSPAGGNGWIFTRGKNSLAPLAPMRGWDGCFGSRWGRFSQGRKRPGASWSAGSEAIAGLGPTRGHRGACGTGSR